MHLPPQQIGSIPGTCPSFRHIPPCWSDKLRTVGIPDIYIAHGCAHRCSFHRIAGTALLPDCGHTNLLHHIVCTCFFDSHAGRCCSRRSLYIGLFGACAGRCCSRRSLYIGLFGACAGRCCSHRSLYICFFGACAGRSCSRRSLYIGLFGACAGRCCSRRSLYICFFGACAGRCCSRRSPCNYFSDAGERTGLPWPCVFSYLLMPWQ